MSCTQRLDVQTRYLGLETLASYYVGTPDPQLDRPPVGQRLIISWNLTKENLTLNDLHLRVTVRLRDHKEHVVTVPITNRKGYYFYDVTNHDYCETGGIVTYKVEIVGKGQIIDCWRHPLWVELIKFEPSQTMKNETQTSQSG